MTTTITITPDLPYFAAAFDCDWSAARRIAAELGPEHVAAVVAAEREAEIEAVTDEQISALRQEAAQAGDQAQVRLCAQAL